MSSFVIGVDVGTTNTKALLLAVDSGQVVALAARPTRVHHPRPEWSEFDPEEMWQGVVDCVRDVVAACPTPTRIAGLCVASMAEAGVPLSADGHPTYPIIAWYDERTVPQRQWWDETLGEQASYNISGMISRHTFSVHKLRWLQQHAPEALTHAAHWLCVPDYILYRLSGVPATDYTIAARTMLFDIHRREWSAPLLAHAQLPASLFPPAFPSGTRIGGLTAEAAALTGLPVGAAIVTGGHDHVCGALGAGVIHPGTLLDSNGTAEGVLLVRDGFSHPAQTCQAGMAANHHVVANQTILIGGLTGSGGFVRWVVENFYADTTPQDVAVAGVDAIPAGAAGLICLPFLFGGGLPDKNAQMGASFVGWRPHHTRATMLRAALEGLGCWLRGAVEHLEALQQEQFSELIVTGGVTRSAQWMSIKADVTGRTLRVPQAHEAVALGAALLAGLGAGLYESAAAAHASLHLPEVTHVPNPARAEFYSALYTTVYRPLYQQIYPLYSRIATLPTPPQPL